MVVAVVALVFAAAGTAGAVGLITGAQIKNNTVRSVDIRNNTVRSRDVRNRSLLAKDFKPGQLPAGPRGLTGATGATGPRGAAGQDGFGLLVYPFSSDVLANGSSEDLVATCPAGTFVTGGDAVAFDDVTGDHVGNQVIQNQGIADPSSYIAHFDNELVSGNDADIFVDVFCANATQVVFKANRGKRKR